MGQTLTASAAALCAVLRAGVAGLPAPLPILEDANVEDSANPPVDGYIRVRPFRLTGERQHARANTFATFLATFTWVLEIYTPRNVGEGPGSDLASAIAGMFRGQEIGELTVTTIDVDPVERPDEDAYFEHDVVVIGEKLSDYDVT